MRWCLVVAVLIGIPIGAHAQCTNGLVPNCPPAVNLQPDDLLLGWQNGQNPHARKVPVGGIASAKATPWIQATSYGVKADGVTSDDRALGRALYACSQAGTKLLLPSGHILLTGAALVGTETRVIENCDVEGVGIPGSSPFVSPGTFFDITGNAGASTPNVFILGRTFAVRGVTFYWPNQHGTTHYPPLFGDNGVQGAYHGTIENDTIVNAWDAVAATVSWVDVRFHNFVTFAANDNFRIGSTPDGFLLSNVRVLPGPWLGLCGSCNGEVGQAASTARVFHIIAAGDSSVSLNVVNFVVVGARYGFLFDANARVTESEIDATWDSVGTIIDASASGAYWAFGQKFSGISAACEIPATIWGNPNTGNAPCFKMGSAPFQELTLNDFHANGSKGNFIETAGADIVLTNSSSLGVGGAADGADYYQIKITASTNPNIRVQNNRFIGTLGSTHVHGISTTGSGFPGTFIVQGNTFQYLNEAINAKLPDGAIVGGNQSSGTNGPVSFIQDSPNSIAYYGNNWDKQPKPTIPADSCGTSPLVPSGDTPNSGFIRTGTGTVLTCAIQMPIHIVNFCTFSASNAISIGAGPSGTPSLWTLTFYAGATPQSSPDMNIFYTCPGM